MDNAEYYTAISNFMDSIDEDNYRDIDTAKRNMQIDLQYRPFSEQDLKRWDDFKVKFPSQAKSFELAAEELGVPVQAVFRERSDLMADFMDTRPYSGNIMHKYYYDPYKASKSTPRFTLSKEQMLKASKSLGNTAKNILGALDNKVLGFYGDINDMLMLQGAPQYNEERALRYLQKNNPELLEGYDPNTRTWRI